MPDKRSLGPRRRSRTRYAVLGMLSLGLETGYAMKKHVEENLSHFWQESYGQIYPVLRQLEEEKLVRRRPAGAGPGPKRNAYALTARGERSLKGWLAETPELPIPRMELLLKLSFGDGAEAGVCIEHVREHRILCERDLEFFDQIEPPLEQSARENRQVAFGMLTLRYGRMLREAELRWCDEAIQRLHQLNENPTPARTGASHG